MTSLDKGRRRTDSSVKKIHESWKLNGNIFFELFLADLDEKMTSAGYRRKRNENESETVRRVNHLFNLWPSSAYFWIISSLEASKWSQITFCILTNILNSISERLDPNFEHIDISPMAKAITVACILIDKLKLSRWLDIGKVRCELGFYCYLYSLTHSLTQTDSIVAYASLGSKLQKSYWIIFYFLWMLSNSILLCHRMCKVTKESSGANKIMKNAIDFTSITLRWTSSSSQQSVFSTTSDGSQRSPNGGESLRSVYLVKIGPK